MRKAIHTTVVAGVIAGLFLTAVGMLLTPQILKLMGTPKDVLVNSVAYFRMYFAGALAVVMYNMCVGILRAVGDSKRPLYYLIISSLTNIALDLLFVGVFRWGVWAAALATSISQFLSLVLCLIRLFRDKADYQLSWRELRIDFPMLGQIVRYGLPSGVQNSIIALANVVVQSNINAFQADVIAGCGTYAKLEGFAFLPITCFAMGLTTFVSQNLGARQYDRTRKGVRLGILCSVVLAELIGAVMFLLAPQLVSFFNKEVGVIDAGTRQARVESLFFFLLAFSHCIAGILRGAGKPMTPMIVMLCSWCLLRVTYITLTVRLIPNTPEVIFSAYPLTWGVSSLVFLIYYFTSDWIHAFDRAEQKQSEKQAIS